MALFGLFILFVLLILFVTILLVKSPLGDSIRDCRVLQSVSCFFSKKKIHFNMMYINIQSFLIVLFFFKYELFLFGSFLNLSFLIPFFTAISSCLIFILKECTLNSTKYDNNNVLHLKKIGYVFITSFIISVMVILFGVLYTEIDTLVYFLECIISIRIGIGLHGGLVLFMEDKVGESSTGSKSLENASDPHKGSKKSKFVRELQAISDESVPILKQLNRLYSKMQGVVQTQRVKVLTDSEGGLSIEPPYDMSKEKAEKVSKEVGIIDRAFNTQVDKLHSYIEDNNEILRKANHTFYRKTLEEIKKEYNDLIEKE